MNGSRSKTILTLTDLDEKGAASIDGLQRAFGLSASEARVASALTEGDTVEKIAATLRVSPFTVKSHLGAIFVKTGTNRQGELVALLSNLPR